jgi:DNA-binding Xre family transcriptional regulator
MTRKVGYRWRLREVMAANGMFHTTDIHPHLAERGVDLSPVQVYRLVAQTPERLNLTVLAALCDILGCTAADLFEPTVETRSGRARKAAGGETPTTSVARRPKRARIVGDESR